MYGKCLALARPHCDYAVLSVRRTLADLSIVNSKPECTMSLSEAPWRWQYQQLEWILWENLTVFEFEVISIKLCNCTRGIFEKNKIK